MVASYPVRYRPRRVMRLAWAGLGVLVALHLVAVSAWVLWAPEEIRGLDAWRVGLFDLGEQESLGTAYGALLLLFLGQLCLMHRRALRAAGAPTTAPWLVLALGAHLLSVDEIARLRDVLQAWLPAGWEWRTVAAAAALAALGLMTPWAWRFPPWFRWHVALGALVWMTGAFVVGRIVERAGSDLGDLQTYHALALGAVLEMAGTLLCLHAVLHHVAGDQDAIEADLRIVTTPQAMSATPTGPPQV